MRPLRERVGSSWERKQQRGRAEMHCYKWERNRNICRGQTRLVSKWQSCPTVGIFITDVQIHTLRFEACEDKDEIVVEIWKLVKLLQFLQTLLRASTMGTHTHPCVACVPVWHLASNIQSQSITPLHLMQAAHDITHPVSFHCHPLWHTSSHAWSYISHLFSLSLTQSHTHCDIRILLAQLSVLLCLGTGSPWAAEALAADPVHLAATPSYRTQIHALPVYEACNVTTHCLLQPTGPSVTSAPYKAPKSNVSYAVPITCKRYSLQQLVKYQS